MVAPSSTEPQLGPWQPWPWSCASERIHPVPGQPKLAFVIAWRASRAGCDTTIRTGCGPPSDAPVWCSITPDISAIAAATAQTRRIRRPNTALVLMCVSSLSMLFHTTHTEGHLAVACFAFVPSSWLVVKRRVESPVSGYLHCRLGHSEYRNPINHPDHFLPDIRNCMCLKL